MGISLYIALSFCILFFFIVSFVCFFYFPVLNFNVLCLFSLSFIIFHCFYCVNLLLIDPLFISTVFRVFRHGIGV